ncbi:MAG: hypothetical protein ABR575_09760 [Actinomycetota bacterium]
MGFIDGEGGDTQHMQATRPNLTPYPVKYEHPAGRMSSQENRTSTKIVLWAALILLVVTVIHTFDHMRQGRSLAGPVVAVGVLGYIVAIGTILLAMRHDRRAWIVAVVVGFGTIAGLIAVHVVPHWSVFSDPYPAAHVDALSWLSLIAFMTAGAALGIAGLRARPRTN